MRSCNVVLPRLVLSGGVGFASSKPGVNSSLISFFLCSLHLEQSHPSQPSYYLLVLAPQPQQARGLASLSRIHSHSHSSSADRRSTPPITLQVADLAGPQFALIPKSTSDFDLIMPITPARPVQVTATPHQQRQSQAHSRNQHQNQLTHSKPELNMDRSNSADPSQWLNFTLPPRRHVPGSGQPGGLPRRSKRGEGWRGSAVTRERFVQSNFRFVLKPTEVLSYGAHFADPDM